jgi:hypothetical protein
MSQTQIQQIRTGGAAAGDRCNIIESTVETSAVGAVCIVYADGSVRRVTADAAEGLLAEHAWGIEEPMTSPDVARAASARAAEMAAARVRRWAAEGLKRTCVQGSTSQLDGPIFG